MSNLKEYVVVQIIGFMWPNILNLEGLSKLKLQGYHYRIITTFNGDESLTEDKELEILKAENSKMRKALEWYADAGNYLGDNGELATAWKQNENIKNKATEALKTNSNE